MNKMALIRKGNIAQAQEDIERVKIHIENNINTVTMALMITDGFESIEIDKAIDALHEVNKGLIRYHNLKQTIKKLQGEC